MAVTNPSSTVVYEGRGDTGPYPITFDVLLDDSGNAEDIAVQRIRISDDDTLDITDDCTITGKNVYTADVWDSNYSIVVFRATPITQDDDFEYGAQFSGSKYNRALDKLTHIAQEINAKAGGVVGIAVSPFMQTVLDDAGAASVRTSIGVYSESEVDAEVSAIASVLSTIRPTVTIANNATDVSNDIDFSAGVAWDKTNLRVMTLTAMTKQLDATWAAGTNAGGLFSGAKAVSTWYYCFVIRKTSDGTIDCGFDTSKTAANIPAGYSGYRRVGAVRTDASGNILAFDFVGQNYLFRSPPMDVDESTGGLPSTNLTNFTLTVPPNFVAMVRIRCYQATVGVAVFFVVNPTSLADYTLSTAENIDIATSDSDSNTLVKLVKVDSSSQAWYKGSSTSSAFSVQIDALGFIDPLED